MKNTFKTRIDEITVNYASVFNGSTNTNHDLSVLILTLDSSFWANLTPDSKLVTGNCQRMTMEKPQIRRDFSTELRIKVTYQTNFLRVLCIWILLAAQFGKVSGTSIIFWTSKQHQRSEGTPLARLKSNPPRLATLLKNVYACAKPVGN